MTTPTTTRQQPIEQVPTADQQPTTGVLAFPDEDDPEKQVQQHRQQRAGATCCGSCYSEEDEGCCFPCVCCICVFCICLGFVLVVVVGLAFAGFFETTPTSTYPTLRESGIPIVIVYFGFVLFLVCALTCAGCSSADD